MSFLNETNKEEFVKLRIRDIKASKEDFDRETYDKKKKKIVPFTYFSPKQFDEYVEAKEKESENEENPVQIKVVGNVRIYKKKYKDIKKDQDFDAFVEEKRKKKIYGSVKVKYTNQYIKKHQKKLKGETYKKYDLYEAKKHSCYGYAEVGENEFVRLQRRNPLIILLIGLLSLGLLVGAGIIIHNNLTEIQEEIREILEVDDTVDAGDGNNSGDDTQIIQETYEIPYVPYVKLTEKEPNLYLINPDGNTVYFAYTLYIDTNGNGTIEKSEAVDAEGNSKAFYKTKLIPPGQMMEADLVSILGKGEYKVIQKINAYNYAPGMEDDQSPCNGSNLTTTIKIG